MVYFIALCTALTGLFGIYLSFTSKTRTKEEIYSWPNERVKAWIEGFYTGLAIGLCIAFLISISVLIYLVELR